MWRSWRLHLVVVSVALAWLMGWLIIAFVVMPRLGDPVSFNKVSNTASPDATKASQSSTPLPSGKFRGNVYHIVFDAYQSEAYQYFLAKTPELNQLPFTYFPNFRSNSSVTYFSVAELFAGDFYSADLSPESWHNAALQSRGMMGYLANGGVRLNLYPYNSEPCYGGASARCKTTMDLSKELLGEGGGRQTAVDVWFLKLIPASLKRELNAQLAPKDEDVIDDSFSDWDYGFSVSNVIAPSQIREDSGRPYFSLQQFMRFLAEEDARPATGQYVFVDMFLPHGPMVLDRDCNYLGRPTQVQQERYLQQVQCADKLMALLVNKLESLGRLDDSLIIFQADHGYYWHPADLGVLYQYHPLDVSAPRVVHDKDDSSTWPSEVIETKSSALLLIKFPGQSAASRSDKPVQMIDIAPTILRFFDIDPGSMRGIPIQVMPETPARERLFFAANYIPARYNPRVFSEYHYADGRWKFAENIKTFGDTDQLFTVNSAH